MGFSQNKIFDPPSLPLPFAPILTSSNHEYMALSEVGPPQVPLWGACSSTRPVQVLRGFRPHLLYWNSMCNQSEGLFRGLSSNHEYMTLSKVEPPQVPIWGACHSTCPDRVSHGLQPHLLYWNSMHDQSEGLFWGLSSNHKYMALSAVEAPYKPIYA